MNEVLTQIAKQAMVEHCISHVRLQEFAELLVKETINQMCCQLMGVDVGQSNNPLFYEVIQSTKKHFGVNDE